MLAEAKREAERLIAEAREQAAREASQQEVVKLAERQAEDVLAEARRQDRSIRHGAEDYADGILENLHHNLGKIMDALERGRAQLASKSDDRDGARPRSITKSPSSSSAEGAPMLDLRALDLRPGDVRRVELDLPQAPARAGRPDVRRRAARRRVPRSSSRASRGGRLPEAAVRGRRPRPVLPLPGGRRRPRLGRRDRVPRAGAASEELRSDYVEADELDVERWARDALVFALPAKILCRPDCAGLCPRCGVRLEQDVEHDCGAEETDPRWEKLRSWRGAGGIVRAAMAVPKKKTSKARRDKRRATHAISAPSLTRVPAVPQAGAPASRVPELRPLPRPRGRAAPRGSSLGTASACATVAVDAMGGDRAPSEMVAGAVEAAARGRARAARAAVRDELEAELARHPAAADRDRRRRRRDRLADEPAAAVRSQPGLVDGARLPAGARRRRRGGRLRRADRRDARRLAASTSAASAASPGPGSPCRCRPWARPCVLIDSGANPDARAGAPGPVRGHGGRSSRRDVLGRRGSRSVGLLSIGEEASQGQPAVRSRRTRSSRRRPASTSPATARAATCSRARSRSWSPTGSPGNVLLKGLEGAAASLFSEVRRAAESSLRAKIGGLLLRPGAAWGSATAPTRRSTAAPTCSGVRGLAVIAPRERRPARDCERDPVRRAGRSRPTSSAGWPRGVGRPLRGPTCRRTPGPIQSPASHPLRLEIQAT